MKFLLALFLLLSNLAFGVGTYSVSRNTVVSSAGGKSAYHKVVVSWVGDAADGTMPVISIPLYGTLVKVVTNPGSTAPTANYDIDLTDPSDSALSATSTALNNRHTTTTEQVYPLLAGSPGTVTAVPVVLAGTYGLAITNNSQAGATGTIELYLAP